MTRVHDGYLITQSKKAAGREYLIGYNPEAEQPYVCWCCENERDYFWGYYTKSLDEAVAKMNERYEEGMKEYQKQVEERAKQEEEKEKARAAAAAASSVSQTSSNHPYRYDPPATSIIGWLGWLLLCWILPLIGPIIIICSDTNETIKNYGKLHIILQAIILFIVILSIGGCSAMFY